MMVAMKNAWAFLSTVSQLPACSKQATEKLGLRRSDLLCYSQQRHVLTEQQNRVQESLLM